ncbi:hypothetical protein [Apibacter sp. HY039]|uniref:hypothetical protein n=1 Tax=Apibacter sp. HY039 TaxID=2501476 RepID=UPI000FEB8DFF|nr:hypothetical protein [Apibacter sp. HY039]
MGVELGNFDSVNEFCTVKLSIYEEKPEKQIGFIHRLKVAFEWSIEYISIIIFTSLVFFISIFVLLLVIDKLKVITISNK